MLFATPKLTHLDKVALQEIEETRLKLKYAMSTPKRWQGVLRRTTLARAIRGSNSIEGYNVTKDDAIAAVEGEAPLDAEKETWQAILGYRNAMTYVLQLAASPYFEYGDGFIRSLHFMMLSYDLAKHPGNWRPGPIYVRDEAKGEIVYEGPNSDSVPILVRELIAGLNDDRDTPAMVKAAMGHLNLVMIHPFSDGNGRMARCLQTLILAREGIMEPHFCSIEEYLGRNTQEYYTVLGKVGKGSWQPSNDAHPWVQFCLVAHYNQGATLLRRIRETERVWAELEIIIKAQRLPERVIFALSDATFGYRVRNATYRTAADIGNVLASRDLQLLVQHGLLVPGGETRGRAYIAGERLRELRQKTREPRPAYKPVLPETS